MDLIVLSLNVQPFFSIAQASSAIRVMQLLDQRSMRGASTCSSEFVYIYSMLPSLLGIENFKCISLLFDTVTGKQVTVRPEWAKVT